MEGIAEAEDGTRGWVEGIAPSMPDGWPATEATARFPPNAECCTL